LLGFRKQNSGQRFFIPPTIHHLTETSAIIYFRLAGPTADGLVRVSSGDEVVQEVPFDTIEVLRQQIILEGLLPATNYQVTVLVDGAELPYLGDESPWTSVEFTTPPYEFPLRAVALGDSGFGDNVTPALAALMAAQSPHMFLHLGDVVYRMNEYDNDHFVNWQQKYFAPFRPLLERIPHYPTVGNHEYDAPYTFMDGLPSYFWMFPPIGPDHYLDSRNWYAFDYNGIQFISLNSQLFFSYAEIRDEQEAWLDEKLARNDVYYTVVYFHVAPYTSSTPHQYDGTRVGEQWSPKFEASNVPLVISGHAHVYERLHRNGVNYVIAGAGSNVIYSLGEPHPDSQTFISQASFVTFDFYQDRIELTAINVNGEIIDQTELMTIR
jgi:hypothetical protein